MPTLENPRYEAFPPARAKRTLLIDAYESAGFVGRRSDCCRLALKDEVADRIAELRALQVELASHYAQERRHLDKVFNDLAAEQTAAEDSKAAMERASPPREAPAAAPSAPRQRPTVAPGAPAHLLASAATSPLKLPGFSPAPAQGTAARCWG